jgi:hypothetical protein
MPVIPATGDVEEAELELEASPRKVSQRPCLKNKTFKTEGLVAWLKWQRTYAASMMP